MVFFVFAMILVAIAFPAYSYYRKRNELQEKAPAVSADNIDLGHLMVEELVDVLVETHGADTMLLPGTPAFEATAETAQLADDMITALTDAPVELVRAARMSSAPIRSTLATATEMESEGERAFVPFLSDLQRKVKTVRATPHLES